MPDMAIPHTLNMADLGIRTLLDLASIFVIARVIYRPVAAQRDHMFSFVLFNFVVFVICLLLGTARLDLGFAFGLFGVFSIMRYRTVMIPVREMGYLFVCISLGILNALVSSEGTYIVLLVANVAIAALVFVLSKYADTETYKEVVYERIALITPDKREDLLADLRTRTGLPVHRVEVMSIDLLQDTAVLHIYYRAI